MFAEEDAAGSAAPGGAAAGVDVAAASDGLEEPATVEPDFEGMLATHDEGDAEGAEPEAEAAPETAAAAPEAAADAAE